MDAQPEWAGKVLERLDKVEALLADLIRLRTQKDYYSTAEVATLLGKAEFTVREWCTSSQQVAFSSAFAPSFHDCLRMKGWLEF